MIIDNEMKLSNRTFFIMREFAQDEFMSKAKKPDETLEVFAARCWYNAFLRTMYKEGYKIWVDKQSRLFFLQEQ